MLLMFKTSKRYYIYVLKAWDDARTLFRSEKPHSSYPKTDTGTKKRILDTCS